MLTVSDRIQIPSKTTQDTGDVFTFGGAKRSGSDRECKYFPMECFHSRGQQLCKFIGTKESVCIRKEFNSHRTGLGHQHGRRFIVLGHQYGRRDVM